MVVMIMVCLCRFLVDCRSFFVFFWFLVGFVLCGLELVSGLDKIDVLFFDSSSLGFVLKSVFFVFDVFVIFAVNV